MAERATYNQKQVHSIIDGSYLCHVAFVQDGRPLVIPMVHWRIGEYLYLHSASKGRFASACVGNDIAISIAHFDGIVLGHSAFNHSYNYRSVVVQGPCEDVTDGEEKQAALRFFLDHIVPGRWDTLRPLTDAEVRSVVIMRVPLAVVSAKIRDDYPDEEQVAPQWPTWIGVIPARLTFGEPNPDPRRNQIWAIPHHIRGYSGIDPFVPDNKK